MNEQNLIPMDKRTETERRELARKAGKASGKARREKKTLADALRAVLDEPTPNDKSLTKREAIAAKAITRLFNDPTLKDLKTLTEILGEFKQVIQAEGDGITIVVRNDEERQKLEKIGDLGI